ncbi:hypothetical protein R3W88_008080 [Solanum pinnatisectum]|uniref:Uncharacterized protein n=1 Tax=Solanum pinnatisectum TaxID=50273 RepID=A0AAV9MA84_9SOLN|nr:hypothetical protein R3W88_008080 [Solanum pinnatisectum]
MGTMKKTSMIKRRWNLEEDEQLPNLVKEHRAKNLSLIGQLISSRYGKSLEHQPFTLEEDNIIRGHEKLGNRWAKIARLIKDFTLENPQPPLKKSFNIRAGKNSGSPYRSDLSNLGFDRFPRLCLYPHITPPAQILPFSVFLSLYPPIAPLCGILPFLSVSPVMHEPSTSLNLCVSNMNNLGFYRLPRLSLYPPSASLGEFFTLLSEMNPMNQIEQICMEPLSASKFTLSNFIPQISITQSGNVGHKYGELVVKLGIFDILQFMIRKEVKNYMLELQNGSLSMNTDAIRDVIVNKIGFSKD